MKQKPPPFEDTLAAFERVLEEMKLTTAQRRQVQEAMENVPERDAIVARNGIEVLEKQQYRHDQFLAGATALSKITGQQVPSLYVGRTGRLRADDIEALPEQANLQAGAIFVNNVLDAKSAANKTRTEKEVLMEIYDNLVAILGNMVDDGRITVEQLDNSSKASDSCGDDYKRRIEARIAIFEGHAQHQFLSDFYRDALATYTPGRDGKH